MDPRPDTPADPGPAPASDPGTDQTAKPAANPAERVISRFGGVHAMAQKLQLPDATVEGWRERGVIPEPHHPEIHAAAEAHGIALDAAELDAAAVPPEPGPHASRPAAASAPAEAEARRAAPAEDAPWTAGTASRPAAAGSGESLGPAGDAADGERAAWPERSEAPVLSAAATAVPNGKPDATPPPRRARGSGLAWLAALIALLAAGATATAPWWAPQVLRQPSVPDLAGRVAALETAAHQPAPAVNGAVAALSDRVAALENRPAPAAPDLAPLQQRLSDLESRVGQSAAPDLAPLQQRLADLENRVRQLATTAADLAPLEQQVAALQTEVRQAADRAAQTGALAQRLDALEQRVNQGTPQAARLEALAAEVQSLRGSLDRAIAGTTAIETRLGALETAQTATGALRQTLNDLSGRVDRLAGDLSAATSRLESVAAAARQERSADTAVQGLLLAINQLRDAIEHNQPLTPALASLRAVAGDDPAVTQALSNLEPHAASGIPSRAELTAGFPAMARAVREAAARADGGSWVDQALGSVRGLVSVRPAAGEVTGNDAGAVLARAETRLNAGRLADAVDALDGLTGPTAAAARDWRAKAQARLTAEQALETLTTAAIKRMAPASTGSGSGSATDAARP